MRTFRNKIAVVLSLAFILGACTTMPNGPSVLVLPGTGKNFDQFRMDDLDCRQFAYQQTGGATASTAATESGVNSAIVGTLLGAAAGAAINGSSGAAAGAGTGLLFGGLAGTSTAQVSGYGAQQRYDNSFIQCMYAKGHRVPVSGHFTPGHPQANYSAPPSTSSMPPAPKPAQ